MAPPQHPSFRMVLHLLLYLLCLFVFTASVLARTHTESHSPSIHPLGARSILAVPTQEDDAIITGKKKSSTTLKASGTTPSSKNKTKLAKPTTIANSTKNQTKLFKPSKESTKNQTKVSDFAPNSSKNKTNLIKPFTKDSLGENPPVLKIKLKKLNSTSKATNSTKPTSLLDKKSSDLTKSPSPKNKTTKAQTQAQSSNPDKKSKSQKKPAKPESTDREEEDDLVSGFRNLPYKFQETLLPDLERISTTSKAYLNKANKEITKGFNPIVGKRYAPTVASIVSFAFVVIPLLLVSLLFNRIKASFSLQKLLIFIQIYLSIYFSILCLSSLVTGLEPLKFFYSTSQSTYVCLQLLQTLAYVLYLLVLLMFLILVFSTETGLVSKFLGLGQTFVGFAVGLHYYMTVFHRAVLRQPPKTSWKVHAVYAMCFLLICLLTGLERRKKAYVAADGGDDRKTS